MIATTFSLPTLDGAATLTGQIDYPDGAKGPVPAVVMVPGTGLFDRDGLLGGGGTDADFVFRDLAKALNARGVAAVRYDYRGVRCNARTMPPCPECATPAERTKHYLDACVDDAVRGGVTPENMRSDIAQVFAHAQKQPGIDAARVAIFAHSEGTLHTAHLVADGLKPSGIVYMGLMAESPKSLLHWQQVERFYRVFDADADADGVMTNDEIKAWFDRDGYFKAIGFPVEQFLSPTDSWTEEALRGVLQRGYEQQRDTALAAADTDPVPAGASGVLASYRWWKQFFTDETTVASLLTGYPGPLFAHNGGKDSQTPGAREFAVVEALRPQFKVPPVLRLHEGKGHTLSAASPLVGPVDADAKAALVEDLVSATK